MVLWGEKSPIIIAFKSSWSHCLDEVMHVAVWLRWLFFFLFLLKSALLNQKSILSFFFICDLVLFCMIFILIPFENLKFFFYFTFDRNFNFNFVLFWFQICLSFFWFWVFVLIFFVKYLDIFNFTLESMNVICPFIFFV